VSTSKRVPFIVSTTLGGILLLVPLAMLGAVLYLVYDILVELAQASGLNLPFNDFVNGMVIGVGALIAVLALCFLVGLALRTGVGSALERRFDDLLEKYLPVVGMLRNLVMQIVGSQEEVLKLKPAEVCLYGGDSRQYALIVEELPDDRVVVFVPSVPAATIGQIHVVPLAAVTILETPVQELLNAVTQWGAGASLMYKRK
jgi:uncharacterized membrane protein